MKLSVTAAAGVGDGVGVGVGPGVGVGVGAGPVPPVLPAGLKRNAVSSMLFTTTNASSDATYCHRPHVPFVAPGCGPPEYASVVHTAVSGLKANIEFGAVCENAPSHAAIRSRTGS